MMSRTQISFEPELQRGARARAAQMGVSLAEYVRTLVARDLARRRPEVDRSIVFALGSSGGSDVARHKDAMIGEAVAAMHRRRRRRR